MKDEMYNDLIKYWGMSECNCQAKAETIHQVLTEIDKRSAKANTTLTALMVLMLLQQDQHKNHNALTQFKDRKQKLGN